MKDSEKFDSIQGRNWEPSTHEHKILEMRVKILEEEMDEIKKYLRGG